MLIRGFWDDLKKPIIGMAPMDGVTDAAFRHMICKYGKPSVIITEFTNVEGLAHGNVKGLISFLYTEIERPIVAQIFGIDPESFYKATVMLCAMGFDGVDINMGCTVRKVSEKGAGAGLIKNPILAKKIIKECKKAAKDWADGISLEKAGVRTVMIEAMAAMDNANKSSRKIIPISVKTRIGYDKIAAEEWAKHLLETEPANITMHGRTLKQLYLGQANWDALANAAKICKGSGVSFLGNGDVKSMEDARQKIKDYGVDGVLVGRAVCGNPWFFSEKEPTVKEKLKAAIEHCKYFAKLNHLSFCNIRKHLGWYCKGFDGAKELRVKLMRAENAQEVEREIKKIFTLRF
ncbi:MAG: tRNA-dihydrouridine synthase [Patescibacteria group bacterium]